jgi:hypothetical protein
LNVVYLMNIQDINNWYTSTMTAFIKKQHILLEFKNSFHHHKCWKTYLP